MSAHTPRPWAIAPHPDDAERLEIVSEYSEFPGGRKVANWIAECDAGTDSSMAEDELQHALDQNKANARLIAAAPELLDALNGLVGLLQLIQDREAELQHDHRFVEALRVIAKAEGVGV